MIDIALDLDNDILFGNGDLSFVKEDAAIRQNLKQLLQYFLGEWFLNTLEGVPYRQIIFVNNPSLDLIQTTIQNQILEAPGIIELVDFQFGYNNAQRVLSIDFDAKSTNGTIPGTISITPTGVGVEA